MEIRIEDREMICLICGTEVKRENMPLHVDHNHMHDQGKTIAEILIILAQILEPGFRVQQGEQTWREKLE